jgi:zinc D-Ala-D-Ala carboxypeptidase
VKHFDEKEFSCGCGCGMGFDDMDEKFCSKLDLSRAISKTAYRLNSSIRCEEHNKDVGGLADSSHLIGHAADIKADTASLRFKVIYGLIKAGFTRIGIYKTFIHVDDDDTKPEKVIW